ncbi:MAG: tripartite tricarboxylate transporter substrate-binding protein [Alphaproteobacteria bacterium]|nr:tripartite tricarboxylate transporter substrate-binding protein [Alphaproteobacteria bacterium]
MKPTGRTSLCLVGIAALAACSVAAQAQALEQFYKNKTVTMIVGARPGGGNDAYARLLSHYMGRHIPGKPRISIKYMPGAGSRIAANMLYVRAPKDGSVFGAVTRVVAVDPLISTRKKGPKAQFDAQKFNWVGSLNKSTNLIIGWHDAPVKTFDDIFKNEMIVAAAGAGTDGIVYPKLINRLMGGKLKIVAGYPGSSTMMLAMERKEVHGRGGVPWSTIKAQHLDWLKQKKINILVQLTRERDKELPDVPMLLERVNDPQHRAVFELLFARQEMGRPYVAPPGLPADRAKALKDAFMATTKDADFLKDAGKRRLILNVISGDEVAAIVDKAYATPKDTIALIKSILGDRSGIAKCAEFTAAEKCKRKKRKKKKKKS